MADGSLKFDRDAETGDVTYGPAEAPKPPSTDEALPRENLAYRMDQTTLDSICDMLTESVAFDEQGLSGWEEINAGAYDLLGIGPESDGDTDYEGVDTSDHPLMLTSLLRFQSKALSMLLPTDDTIIRTDAAVDLDEIEDEEERAKIEEEVDKAGRRVSAFYRDYLFEKLPSYEEDTDQILWDMGLMGLGIRKIVVDRSRQATPVMPVHVPVGELIVSYGATSFRQGRLTHKMDMPTADLIRRMGTGAYRPVKLHDQGVPEVGRIAEARDKVQGLVPAGWEGTETHRVYEIYADLVLDADRRPDSLPRPYIITVHGASREILSIQRNWMPSDPDETPIEHFVGYLYHPGKNSTMGVGLGHILSNMTRALRKAQRRALEAAYLQNHPSGFKLSNLTIRDGETQVMPGQLVDVDSPVGDIRQAVMMQMFQGPSPGLMQLADKMEQNGRELGGIASIDFASMMKSGIAAGPAMAAFEESTEFQTAVHRRLYKAHRKELSLIHDRMQEVRGSQPILYGVGSTLREGDLQKVKILPYMKPGQASRQRAILEAQLIYDTAKDMPDVVDKRGAAENYIRTLGSPDAVRLLRPDPAEEQPEPADPVSEYAMVLRGKPIAAGMAQNHQAHIDAHASQMRMLQNSQLPVEQGDAVSAILAAHIAEHMGLQLAAEVGARAGATMDQISKLPPEVQNQLAPQIAAAIREIEEERRPKEQQDTRLAQEQLRQQGQAMREQQKAASDERREQIKAQAGINEMRLKQDHEREMEDLKAQHARELQGIKDAGALDRELEDNAVALKIAQMKGTGSGSANAGARAGARG